MDVFEEAVSELGIIGINFGSNNLFACEWKEENDTKESGRLLSIYRDYQTMTLHISVTTQNSLPKNIPYNFFIDFAEHAIEPFRNGYGVGLFPNSKKISIYKNITIADKTKYFIAEEINELIECSEQWDEKIMGIY